MAMTLDDFFTEWHSDSPYISAHTSGSTGTPKDIKLLKSDMLISARATNELFGISENSVLAIPLSMDYIAGKMMAVRALAANCELIELNVSNKIMIDSHIDLISIVPSQVDSLVAHSKSSLVSNVIVGGSPLGAAEGRMLCDNGFRAYCSYGMTETCSHVALAEVSGSIPVYKSMPGISFACDERNCLIVKSDEMSFGQLQTNDIVELINDNSFRWIGRADNIINSGGIKISPEELESILAHYIEIPFYICGIPDSRWGMSVALVAEGPSDSLNEIRHAIERANLGYRKPRHIYMTETLPRTSNGKLRRLPPPI